MFLLRVGLFHWQYGDWKPGCREDLTVIKQMIQAAVAAAFQERESVPSPREPRLESVDPTDSDTEEVIDLKEKYVQGQELKELLQHIKQNLGLPELVLQEESEDFFSQSQREPDSLLLHPLVKKVMENEWKEIDKRALP
ncbi:hypothetical protein NDU88_006119 [Pleurodeles waltl]|uniref:Uncharacterized protein n=1 Tax=Pleurodeles waltl TaxID=8319 RepID=A0AAV7NPD0_PLEWA|nr:hypothetical protein NDU88_006119 [Pleurodeles waltl]